MIRRYAVMILGLTVGVLSMHAQDLQTRNLIFRSGSTISTLNAPNSGGPFTYNFPLSNGTLLMSTDPNLGTAGVMYSVSGSQDTATQSRWLFNVRYSATPTLPGATASLGGNINSSAYLDANATGLTINAVAGATSTSRGLAVNASGGTTNYGIDIQSGSLKINAIDGVLFATSGVVSAVTALPSSITIPAGQVTGITQYALPVGGATGLASLSTGTAGYVLISGGAIANPNWQSVASVLGANVVVYGSTSAQTASIADGANYLFNVNYSGAATGNALGAVITSDATGGTNASATGLTVNAVKTGTGIAQGIVVNTAAGNDLVINEDAITRNGDIAINTGTANTLSTNGNFSSAGNATLGTATSTSGGSLVLHDNNAVSLFTGTLQGAATYTADRTYTLPDADGTFAVIAGTLNSNAFVYSNNAGGLATTASATNGQILIGSSGAAPVAATPTGTRGIAITPGAGTLDIAMPTGASDAVLRYDGTNWVNSGTVFTVSSTGNTVTQGDATFGTAGSTTGGQLRLHDENAGTAFFAMINGPATLASNQIYNLPALGGTFLTDGNGWATTGNGHTVTDGTNNLIGTTTAAAIRLITNSTTRLTISSAGVVTVANLSGVTTGSTLATDEGLVIASSTGVLSKRSLSDIVGSKTVAGTADGQVAVWSTTNSQYEPVAIATFGVNATSGNVNAAGDLTLGTSAVAGGSIVWNDNTAGASFSGTMQGPTLYTAARTYTLPDADGTFAVIAGTMNSNAFVYANNAGALATTASATDGQILIGSTGAAPVAATLSVERGLTVTNAAGSITLGMPAGTTTGATMRFDGTNWVTTGTTYGIDANGNPTLGSGGQAAASSLTFNDGTAGDNFTVTLVSPSVLTADVTITLPTTSGTLLTTGNGYVNGGNSFGAGATLGLNDNFGLDIRTNGTSRIGIAAAGAITLSNLSGATTGSTLAAQEGLVIASSTGVLSKRSLSDIVGSKTVAGTADGQVAVWSTTNSQYEPVAIATFGVNATSGNVNAAGDLTLGTSAVAGGSIVWNDNTAGASFSGTMQGPTLYTAARTYTLPDADGTFAVIAGTMNSNAFVYANNAGALATTASATDGQILIGSTGAAPVAATLSVERGLTVTNAAGSITLGMPAGTTTGATMRFDGTNWVTTGTTYGIDANGNPTLGSGGQAAASSLTFNDGTAGDNFTVTLVSPSVLTADVTITLPTTSGTILTSGSGWATTGNGHTVTDGTNNLIGTTTTAAIRLITDNTTRLTISSAGAFTFAGTAGTSNVTMTSLSGVTTGSALGTDEGIVIASSTGALTKRSLANVVGSKTVAGSANNQVAIWDNTDNQYEPVAIANYSLDASGNVTNGGTLTVTGATTANGTVTLGNQSSSATDANVAPTITTAFLEVAITNTDGTPNSVTLPTGTNGQVLYMRLTVTNNAGTSDVTLVNSNASVIETFAQGADYQRVLHMIYVANSSKWVVLSNVAP